MTGMNNRKKYITLGLAMSASVAFAQHPLIEKVTHSNPMTLPVQEEDIEWQRIVYREIAIDDANNAGLFYTTNGDCLFSHIFKMVVNGTINAYNYRLHDDVVASEENRIDMETMLKDFHIDYLKAGDSILVSNEDIPAADVRAFYVKESNYYDIRNSSFRSRCLAICPILFLQEDFSEEVETKYPMFWVTYKDLEPKLRDVMVFGDAYNTSSMMSANEFFSAKFYTGKIYKVFDMRGRALQEYCGDSASLYNEQQKIEKELVDVRQKVYNTVTKHEPVEVEQENSETDTVRRPSIWTNIKGLFKKNRKQD